MTIPSDILIVVKITFSLVLVLIAKMSDNGDVFTGYNELPDASQWYKQDKMIGKLHMM